MDPAAPDYRGVVEHYHAGGMECVRSGGRILWNLESKYYMFRELRGEFHGVMDSLG